MNVPVKYEKGERVLFLLFDPKHTGKFDFCSGKVNKISITLSRNTSIKYSLLDVRVYKGGKAGVLSGDYNLDEDVLFKNEQDLFKHFQRNIRTFLDKEHQYVVMDKTDDEEYDDEYGVNEDEEDGEEEILLRPEELEEEFEEEDVSSLLYSITDWQRRI